MGRWFVGFAKRFLAFSSTVLAGAMGFSWLFGFDEEVKAWASNNRLGVALCLVLAAIAYAMYDWLEDPNR